MKQGDRIRMKGGGEAVVAGLFGAGGQGTVYKVSFNGSEYALKWYHSGVFRDAEQAFCANLERNAANGAPSPCFLWPLGVTERRGGSFGYLMKIRPQGYEELTRFFVGSKRRDQVRFRSFEALFSAAVNIAEAFRELHSQGYSYQDINNGNFFIDPLTGKVLICDNDNVAPYGTSFGVMGKQRWMAPEIVRGECMPDKISDRFSLALVLFRLMFISHPLEGVGSTPPCMTKAYERLYYGTNPIFVYDPDDSSNRPVPGTDSNLKIFWKFYPQYVRDLFTRAFSKAVMMKQAPRVLESEWLDMFFRLRAELGVCPGCGGEVFFEAGREAVCSQCGQSTGKVPVLACRGGRLSLPLHPKMKFYVQHADSSRADYNAVLAETAVHPSDPNLLGLKNAGSFTWKVILPDGSQRTLAPGRTGPVADGLKIDFLGDGTLAEIKLQ